MVSLGGIVQTQKKVKSKKVKVRGRGVMRVEGRC
jgi:hypothetical protein